MQQKAKNPDLFNKTLWQAALLENSHVIVFGQDGKPKATETGLGEFEENLLKLTEEALKKFEKHPLFTAPLLRQEINLILGFAKSFSESLKAISDNGDAELIRNLLQQKMNDAGGVAKGEDTTKTGIKNKRVRIILEELLNQYLLSKNILTEENIKETKSVNNKELPNSLKHFSNDEYSLPHIEHKGWNKNGSMRGNWFFFGDKPGGAEPGGLATFVSDETWPLFLKYFANKEDRLLKEENIKDLLGKIDEEIKGESDQEKLKKILSELSAKLEGESNEEALKVILKEFTQKIEEKADKKTLENILGQLTKQIAGAERTTDEAESLKNILKKLCALGSSNKFIGYVNNVNAKTIKGKALQGLNLLSQEMWKDLREGNLPMDVYMAKQDYPPKQNGHVSPSTQQIATDPLIKKLPDFLKFPAAKVKKYLRALTRSEQQNINAAMEGYVNDMYYQGFGMNEQSCQDQKVVQSTYSDGTLKVLTMNKWKVGAKPGDKFLKHATHHEGVFLNEDGSAMNIENAGLAFILGLAFGDRDVVGDGGNKMVIKDKDGKTSLFFIDPGLALREKSQILNTIQSDFSFKQPPEPWKKFRNLSALTDCPIEDKMVGLLCVYLSFSEESRIKFFPDPKTRENISNAIKNYKEKDPKYRNQLENVEEGRSVDKLHEQHIKFYSEKLEEITSLIEVFQSELQRTTLTKKKRHEIQQNLGFLSEQSHNYGYILFALIEARDNLDSNCHKLFGCFNQRMQLNPVELRFLDDMEKKYSDKVSDLSPEGRIKLNHSRVVSGRAVFEIQKITKENGEQEIILTLPEAKKAPFTQWLKEFGIEYKKCSNGLKLDLQSYQALLNAHEDPNAYSVVLHQYKNSFEKEFSGDYFSLEESEKDNKRILPEIRAFKLSLTEAAKNLKEHLTEKQQAELDKAIDKIVGKAALLSRLPEDDSKKDSVVFNHIKLQLLKTELYDKFDKFYPKRLAGFFTGKNDEVRRKFFKDILGGGAPIEGQERTLPRVQDLFRKFKEIKIKEKIKAGSEPEIIIEKLEDQDQPPIEIIKGEGGGNIKIVYKS